MIVHKHQQVLAAQAQPQQMINMQPQQQQLELAHYAPGEPQPAQYSSNPSADHYSMYQQQQHHHNEPQRFQPQQQQVAPNRGQPMSNHNRLAPAGYGQRYGAMEPSQGPAQVPPNQAPYQQAGYEQQVGAGSHFGAPEAPHQRGLVGPPMRQQAAQSRVPPYASQPPPQQQIPVRPMAVANRASQQQQLQYKREMQQQSPVQQQHSAYVNGAQPSNGYHMGAASQPFVDQLEQVSGNPQRAHPKHVLSLTPEANPSPQYPSNSPTLLQQQLNRQQTGPPYAAAPPQQRLVNSAMPPGQPRVPPAGYAAASQKAVGVCRQPPVRYEQQAYADQQVAGPPSRAAGAHMGRAEQTYYPAVGGAQLRQTSGPQQVRQRPQQQQVLTSSQMPPEQHHGVVHHHHQQQQQHQLLGNPTPPLTPTNASPMVGHLPARAPLMSTGAQPMAPGQESHQW